MFTRTRYGVRRTEASVGIHPEVLRAFDQIERTLDNLDVRKGWRNRHPAWKRTSADPANVALPQLARLRLLVATSRSGV